jgi:hypothetical protein
LPRHAEQGIVIALLATAMLLVIGAMAALSIDVVTFYTARSEAQLAADAAALAGARVLANSGITSNPGGSVATADNLARAVALQVAEQNQVSGSYLTAANVPTPVIGGTDTNPTVTVKVQITNLPTFFARIWGRTRVTVGASATAEAYNPSGASVLSVSGTATPVAPLCVKPWLLPNIDPTSTSGNPIFDSASGAIFDPTLVGKGWPNSPPNPGGNPDGLYALCAGDCSTGITAPLMGAYYPGAAADFPVPTALPACSAGFNPYQLAVAGCIQQPISCGAISAINPGINIDTIAYANNTGSRDSDAVQAAKCLTHYNAPGDADSIDTLVGPGPPFQFLGGNQNPVAGAVGQAVLVSDSLVTIPVINNPPGTPTNPVTVIGFLQVFLNPSALTPMPYTAGPASPNEIPATIINLAGCGTSASGLPIFGNGASPVSVRLISP